MASPWNIEEEFNTKKYGETQRIDQCSSSSDEELIPPTQEISSQNSDHEKSIVMSTGKFI